MPPPKSTTTGLLAKVAGGDRDALKSLYEAQSARLHGLAMAILRDRPAAADALQETFLRVWQRAGQHDPADGDADTWLAAVARHAALDVARARGREAPADDPGLGDTAIDADALEPLATGVGARLRDRLRQLEPKVRQSIVFCYVHGLSQAEIAARLNEPPGAVKAWIRSGLARRCGNACRERHEAGGTISSAHRPAVARGTGRRVRARHARRRDRRARRRGHAGRPGLARGRAGVGAAARPAGGAGAARGGATRHVGPDHGAHHAARGVHVARGPRTSWLWRGWAIGASLAAAGLAAFILLPILGPAPPPARRLMATLVNASDRTTPTWLVDVDGHGQLRLMPIRALTGPRAIAPAGRVFQFWAIVPGGQLATDLGLLASPPVVMTVPVKTIQPTEDMI